MIVIDVHCRILLGSSLNALVDLLRNMWRQALDIVIKSRNHYRAKAKLDFLDLIVQLAELRRQIQALFDQQFLDRLLDGSLALGNECFEIVCAEGVTQQNLQGRR